MSDQAFEPESGDETRPVARDGSDASPAVLGGAPTTIKSVDAADSVSAPDPSAPSGAPDHFNTSDLEEVKQRILARNNALTAISSETAVENGRDLIKVKKQVGHGAFGKWLKVNVRYSSSKANKEMQLAAMFEEAGESVNFTNLPLSLLYDLAAPGSSDDFRNDVVKRIVAGQNVESDLRAELKKRRAERKEAKVGANRKARGPEPAIGTVGAEAEIEHQQVAGFDAALLLIKARLGDELPHLLKLATVSVHGSIFSEEAERELQVFAREMEATRARDNGSVEAGGVTEYDVVSGTAVTTPRSCEAGPERSGDADDLSTTSSSYDGSRRPASGTSESLVDALPAVNTGINGIGAAAPPPKAHNGGKTRFAQPATSLGRVRLSIES